MRFGTGFGLRLQIVVALSAAMALAALLLGALGIGIAEQARMRARMEDARATATLLEAALTEEPGEERFRELAEAVVGRSGIRGAEYRAGTGGALVHGVTGIGLPVEAGEGSLGAVRLWIRPPRESVERRAADLFALYVAVTFGGILLFAYAMLTSLIVRPVEAITRASERMAGGKLEVEVPRRGAAEVVRLADSFNRMAAQLRADREALEARLDELTRTTRELEAVQEQVLRSARLASVGRLSAGVAHEIGNPLAAILGLVELLREGDLDDVEQAEFLSRIQSETERIHGIIRDLLDFSRRGARREGEESESVDVAEVVEDAVGLVAPQKGLRGTQIETRVRDDLPFVRAQRDRLTQVVVNLLLNAADALGGEGSIRIELDRTAEGDLSLSVTDTGPGIEEEVLEHLFEPFVTTKAVGKGTGLGLAVCHTLVEQMGGAIRAENPPEGGARFIVTFSVASERDRQEELGEGN